MAQVNGTLPCQYWTFAINSHKPDTGRSFIGHISEVAPVTAYRSIQGTSRPPAVSDTDVKVLGSQMELDALYGA